MVEFIKDSFTFPKFAVKENVFVKGDNGGTLHGFNGVVGTVQMIKHEEGQYHYFVKAGIETYWVAEEDLSNGG